MNIKLHNLAAGLVLLPLCGSAFAADQQFTGTFKTIKNVTISEITPIVINGLQPASGSICTLTTPTNTTSAWPGETTMKIAALAGTSTLAAGATNGAMTGAGCSTSTPGVPGIYEIDGAEGAEVTITLTNTLAIGGLQFSPTGCAGDYNGAPDGDLCTALPAASATAVTLASVADQTNSAGQGVPVAGKSRIALGGTVTSSIGLTAASPYVVPFDITVTY